MYKREKMSKLKRLAIFCFYNKDGIVFDYVLHLLLQMKTVSDRIIIVSNCHLEGDERDKFSPITTNYFERENRGFDSGAYKDILCNELGWEKVLQYDELILFNDTFYGFFTPVSDIFRSMQKNDCDFWGITVHYETKNFPEHLQSYFLVIRNTLLHDSRFADFFITLSYAKDFEEAIFFYETAFTSYFSSFGYKYASYIDTSIWRNSNPALNTNFQVEREYKLLSELGCPVLKKKNIALLEHVNSNDSMKSISYIQQYTDYDVNLIWDHLLKSYEVSVLHKAFHFNVQFQDYACSCKQREIQENLLCLVWFISDRQNILELEWYLKCLPEEICIYIYADEDLFYEIFALKLQEKGNVKIIRNLSDVFSCLPLTYKYYLFLNDEVLPDLPSEIADKIRINNFDSLIKNANYLLNLLQYLDDNTRSGMLVPYNLEQNFVNDDAVWKEKYTDVRTFVDRLGIKVPISDTVKPFAFSCCFCARYDAIKQLFHSKITNRDFRNVLQYALLYVAQANGYLTLQIRNAYVADSERKPRDIMSILQNLPTDASERHFVQEQAFIQNDLQNELADFCRNKSAIYIYGCGIWGKKIAKILTECGIFFDGFIVSSKIGNPRSLMEHPVLELSDATDKEHAGFVLGVGLKARAEVIQILTNNNIKNYF